MENNADNKEQPQKQIVFLWAGIMILAGILMVLWQTLIRGSGTISDYIAQSVGGLGMTAIFSFIIGITPYLIFKKHISRAGWIIFSISFLLVSIATLIGVFYRN